MEGTIRLNKYLSDAGVCSRREADRLVEEGKVRVDGEIAVMNAYLAGLLGCGTDAVYETLEDLLNKILPKKALREYGTKREDLPEWAKSVIDNQQRLLKNSFIPMTEELVLKIYQDLY